MSMEETARLELLKSHWSESEELLLSRTVRLVGNRVDARDILQKAAMIAVEQFNEAHVANQQEFVRWIWARTKWIAIDTITERKKWAELPDELPELLSEQSPADVLAGKELWAKLVDGLPKKEQLVARLRLEGYGATEIAKRIGEKPANIRSNWRFAKQKILAALEEYMNE